MIFHHLGIACDNMQAVLQFIDTTQTIISQSEVVFDPQQNAYLCMVQTQAAVKIELITGEQVRNFIKRGLYLYHTCWEVADLDTIVAKLCADGLTLVSGPKPAVLFNDRRVCFLYSPLGLIELLESC
jgi:methylmalonyl-CoA/ethylmalonyl-CoA epimerase